MQYKVQWNYKSGMGGPWMAGDVVELEEARAADINRDSPGVLQPAQPAKAGGRKNRKVQQPAAARAEFARHKDRAGDRGDQGAMSRADHPGLFPGGAE